MERRCQVEACESPHFGRGWCRMHYTRWLRHGDAQTVLIAPFGSVKDAACSVNECGRPMIAKGFCGMHRRRARLGLDMNAPAKERFGPVCTVDECGGRARSRGLCNRHRIRLAKYGDVTVQKHPNLGTGQHRDSVGYVFIHWPEHPLAKSDGYVAEHRLVAWEAGLFDDPSLVIHHKNLVKDDNRIENLAAMTRAEHTTLHCILAGQGDQALHAAVK